MKVEFSPPKTTSLLQRMDQGVIKTFTAYYTRRPFAHTSVESMPKPDEIGNEIEKVVDLVRRIILEVDSDDFQELLDSHNQGLTIEEPMELIL